MGSMSSKPMADALEDIARTMKHTQYQEEIGHNDSLATTSMDSGCHLEDPRSPSSDITRTPIHSGQKLRVMKEKAQVMLTLFDPRSPGVPRTPIYARDEDEEEARTFSHSPLLDVTPMFPPLPTDSSTPLKTPPSDEHEQLNRSLERSLSDPNLSLDAHDEKLLIRSSASPIGQNKAVTKIRRSMKLAKNHLVRQKTEDSPRSPRPGLKAMDMNSPRVFVQKKASLKVDHLKRRHSVASPYKIETQDKENLPYS